MELDASFWWKVILTILVLAAIGLGIYAIVEGGPGVSGNTTNNDVEVIVNLGTQTDDLDMGGNRITRVGTPTTSTDAVDKGYVDEALTAIPTQTRDVSMGGKRLIALGTATQPTDAVSKGYVDGALSALPTQTASLDMGGQKITSVATPTASTDVATKGFVDTSLSTLPAQTAPLDMGGQKIISVATPTASTDVATKDYVDLYAQGVTYLAEVKTKTAAALPGTLTYDNGTNGVGATLTADSGTALGTIGGYAVSQGERLLVDQQDDKKQNGIYVATTVTDPYVLTRASDLDGSPVSETKVGTVVLVTHGTYANSRYVIANKNAELSNPPNVTLGTDDMIWVQQSGGGSLSTPLNRITDAGTLGDDQLYVGASGGTTVSTLTIVGSSYSPTITNVSGLTSYGTPVAYYVRAGNLVMINFFLPVTTQSTGAEVRYRISIPVARTTGNFSDVTQAIGTGTRRGDNEWIIAEANSPSSQLITIISWSASAGADHYLNIMYTLV